MISENRCQKTISELINLHSNEHSATIHQCVKMVASCWIDTNGTEIEFQEFCTKNYINDPLQKNKLFEKLSDKFEKMAELGFELSWSNSWSLMMETGPLEPVDILLAEVNPFVHLHDDCFRSKLSHFILLNFPILSLKEKAALANNKSNRLLLAQSQLAEESQSRIPSQVAAKEISARNYSHQFISHLTLDLERIIFNGNDKLSHTPLKVDIHWGLRDQIVFLYQDKAGLKKQRLLSHIWEKATLEEISHDYYSNVDTTWDPLTDSHPTRSMYRGRYKALLGLFQAIKEQDAYLPEMPNYIDRSFESGYATTETKIRKLFTDFLTNPQIPVCANYLKSILNRELHSFDVVFNQFGIKKTDAPINYDELVREKFPTLDHFHAAIPRILEKFGFDSKLAHDISAKIKITTCRAGGFASWPKTRGGRFILVTPSDNKNMNYTAFATVMHELGHCVEGYLSQEQADYFLLGEVPCAAFSEAFAFIFDSRCREVLEMDEVGHESHHNRILNLFWACFLHCGLALVDLDCWRWMYAHSQCTENELKSAVIEISRTIWNKYFYPIMNEKDSIILAGYNVMVTNPLYISEYALSSFIQSQIEHYLEDKIIGHEMPRMCKTGRVTPDKWMEEAVGKPITCESLIKQAATVLRDKQKANPLWKIH